MTDPTPVTPDAGLTEAERTEASTRALADDLCAGSTHPRDEEGGEFHCQECYDLANTVHDSPWFERILAARAEADRAGERGRGEDGLRAAWAHVVRDHNKPPRKTENDYDYRMGWWDAVVYADRILTRGLRACDDCPAALSATPAPEAGEDRG